MGKKFEKGEIEDCLECRMVGGFCMSVIGAYLWHHAKRRKGLERNTIIMLSCGSFALGFARLFNIIPPLSKKESKE